MPPNHGLTHLKEYDITDSNIEFIGSSVDHNVKYNSALTEPAWNNNRVGKIAGLYIWRIESFEVIPWPSHKTGQFHEGDSYIILHSYQVGEQEGTEKLVHEIFFWLGSRTTQDEAGTAAYKTVELDEFLHGEATQLREVQGNPSEAFVALFPRMRILSGGVKSGFTHVEEDAQPAEITTLLRVFKLGNGKPDSLVALEVEPTWRSLDDGDVFILDKGDKIWVWHGKKCSPMEKAKGAQVVHDLTLAKHVDVEVLSQTDSRSGIFVNMLGGEGVTQREFEAPRPMGRPAKNTSEGTKKLFRLSDKQGELKFDLVKEGRNLRRDDFDGNDVFLLDIGSAIWVWRGLGASKGEKGSWLDVAQWYIRQLGERSGNSDANSIPMASVLEGNENHAFMRAIEP
ncbi:probable actin regulatory proteins (gelsolin/villin family) [Rhynchosporium secalis]|uniref:Probable actin regulatory proteins (Gelsolin/villin family) n=1 Tax=Rhynchosporium secalis TaxID=38038 RepID=A0A1E1M5N2_RHYSE|nr:probable actin regulatory proteins (gelsolin/villin family) [Rhynchosporium secalis]